MIGWKIRIFVLFCLICFPSESTVQALGKRWSYSELCTNLPLKALQAKVLRSPSLLTKLQEVVHWVLEIILCLRPAEWPAWWVAARLWLLSVAFGSTLHGVTCTALEARVRLGSEMAQGAGWAVRGAVPCAPVISIIYCYFWDVCLYPSDSQFGRFYQSSFLVIIFGLSWQKARRNWGFSFSCEVKNTTNQSDTVLKLQCFAVVKC